jgi:hypothetical protein
MLESCASLRLLTPDAAAEALVKLITDIRRVLMAEMTNAAKLTEVFALVDAAAPPPPPGWQAEGADRPGGARSPSHAGITAVPPSPGLFTHHAAAEAGEPLRAVIAARTACEAGDYPELRARGFACKREGHLVTASGRQVAAVSSVYLRDRIAPEAAWLLAHTSTPLGLALEPYGAWRENLEPDGERTRGLLKLPVPGGDVPVAMAWELAL